MCNLGFERVACNHGRAKIDDVTKLKLFGDAGGYCQRPQCGKLLFADFDTGRVHIAEMAHIIARSPTGPRAKETARAGGDHYDNLIVLCPTCHTIIDKAPSEFPAETVIDWKLKHRRRIDDALGVLEHEDRASVRNAFLPLLEENHAIFTRYGPHNDYRMNPESEYADVWKRKLLCAIIPNNRRMLSILDRNRGHLQSGERQVVEQFRQHVKDLEARHIHEPKSVTGMRFPLEMNELLADPK